MTTIFIIHFCYGVYYGNFIKKKMLHITPLQSTAFHAVDSCVVIGTCKVVKLEIQPMQKQQDKISDL